MHMISVLFTTAVILISAGAARRLFGRFEPEFRSNSERFIFEAGVGLGLLAYLIMLLGVIQVLNRWSILAVLLILLAVVCCRHIKLRKGFVLSRPWDPVISFAVLGIVAIGVWALIKALAPPSMDDWDSLAYHLAVPKLYLRHGGIFYIPFTSHSNFPFTVEMLYTAALSFGLVPAAKLFHFGYWVFTLVGIYAICRAYFGSRAGAVAALIFASIPLAAWEATTAYIDLAATFYTLLAALAVLGYLDSGDRRWVIWAGLAAGLAASTKMTALGTIPLLILWVVIAGVGAGKELARRSRPDAVLLGAVSMAAAAPWYIKSWIYTGNPVYPFFYNLFGGKGWDSRLAETYRLSQMHFGMGHRTVDFLMAPWNVTIYSERFYDRPGLYVGFLLLALLPLAVTAAVRDRRCAGLGFLSFGLAAIWFALSHQSRYLLPAFAILAVPSAVAFSGFRGLSISRWVGTAAIALSAFFAFLFISQMGSGAVRVALGFETAQDYLSRTLDTYRVTETANRMLPADAKIVLINDTRGFYLDRNYIWGDWAHNTIIPYSRIRTAEQFVRFLRSIKVTHALIRNIHHLPKGHEANLVNSAIDKGYFRPAVFDESFPVALYEVANN